MNAFTQLTSKVMPLLHDNIDTDQIIPARYLKATDKANVAEGLFADWCYLSDSTPNLDFVFNRPEYKGAQILLVGDNFGCGSSREHAPWALIGRGIKVVISTSFADIFKNNALKNGLLTIGVDKNTHELLCDLLEEVPTVELVIDLENQQVTIPDGSYFEFSIDDFSKDCLLNGTDQFGFIQSFEEEIKAYEEKVGLHT
jgi:3-isopropylmalate/(R)-2-methylmalate dehydratase small subunit